MILRLLCNLISGVTKLRVCQYAQMYATLLWTSFHFVTKICKPLVVYRFNAWRYFTPRRDVIYCYEIRLNHCHTEQRSNGDPKASKKKNAERPWR